VDDLETSRKTLRMSLKAINYSHTLEAINGEDALAKVKEDSRIRLILLDWNMPKMSGMEFYRRFSTMPEAKNVRVIMITAESLQANIITAIQAGINQYIVKPAMPKILEEKIVCVVEKDINNLNKRLMETEGIIQGDDALSDNERNSNLRSFYCSLVSEIQETCEIYPWKAAPHFMAGNIHQKLGQLVEAQDAYRKALNIDPKHELSCMKLAKLYLKRKQGNKAIKVLASMVIVKPTSAIYQILGEAYLAEGETNKAIKAFNDSIRLGDCSKNTTKHQLAEKHEGLGNAFRQKQHETNDKSWEGKTVTALKKSIEFDPTHISAHFNLISVYKQAGQHEKALELIKKTAEITPDTTDGWIALGKIFLENKEIPKSTFAFKRAVESSTNQSQAFFDIGDIYDAFNAEMAMKYLVRANSLSPKQFHILNKLGIVSRKLGNTEDSVSYYQQALEVEDEDEKLHFNLACAYLKHNKSNAKEKGCFHLEKALELTPDFKEAKELLVQLS